MTDQVVDDKSKEGADKTLDQEQVSVGGIDDTSGDVAVDETGAIVAMPDQQRSTADDDDDDERLVDSQAGQRSPEEQEAIRQRRREEKRRKKENFQNMKRELQSRDAQLQELQEQVAILQRSATGGELAQIENALKQSADDHAFYKRQIAEAVAKADGDAVAEATEKMSQAAMRHAQLASLRKNYQNPSARPKPMDPRVLSNAQRWMEDHDWYDPASRDEDSFMVRQIDNRLAQEGYDPRTREYWDELTRRGKKYLPHRFSGGSTGQHDDDNDDGEQRRSSPAARQTVGSGAGNGAGKGGGKVFILSRERVQAIKDAGKWDDAKERAAMIARYKEYDRQHRN